MTAMIAAFAAILGAAVGSFLNVVVHRVPRKESLVRPPSRCPACEREISPTDNIPIVSWLVLRGRCRHCKSRISARYPLIEGGTALLWAACALRFDSLEEAAFSAIACSLLVALTAIDLEHHRLPNAIVLPATVGAIAWVISVVAVTATWNVAVTALLSGAVAFTLFFLIAIVSGGMGFGDVKLAGFIGVVTGRFGWEVTVAAVMGSFFIGGLVAVGVLIARRGGRKTAIAFGPAMAAGAVVALFAGAAPVRAWLNL